MDQLEEAGAAWAALLLSSLCSMRLCEGETHDTPQRLHTEHLHVVTAHAPHPQVRWQNDTSGFGGWRLSPPASFSLQWAKWSSVLPFVLSFGRPSFLIKPVQREGSLSRTALAHISVLLLDQLLHKGRKSLQRIDKVSIGEEVHGIMSTAVHPSQQSPVSHQDSKSTLMYVRTCGST